MKKICIDPGHGGNDPGAIGLLGLQEKSVNLRVANILADLCAEKDIEVIHTRTTDVFIQLSQRSRIANEAQVDLLVSIHCNAVESRTAQGVETLVFAAGTAAHRIATNIQRELVKVTNERDRGVKIRTDLAVLRGATMPAILLEIGFISHPETEQRFRDDEYLKSIAQAVLEGITA